eukprot:scaffold60498_cov41-Phaeocystis_antarctica.AAC.2
MRRPVQGKAHTPWSVSPRFELCVAYVTGAALAVIVKGDPVTLAPCAPRSAPRTCTLDYGLRSGLGLRVGYGLGLRSGLGLRPRSTHLVRTADGDAKLDEHLVRLGLDKLDEHRPVRPQAQRGRNGLFAPHRHLEDVGGGEVAQGTEVLVARTDDEADF